MIIIVTASTAIKAQAIVSLLLMSVAPILAVQDPARGYEASIYEATSPLIWVALAFLMIGGISTVIYQIYTGGYNKTFLWVIGLFQVVFAYIISLSLHVVRGYYMWGMYGDTATHIGYTNELISYARVFYDLFYPITHIYLTEIWTISSVDLIQLHFVLPLFASVLFLLFMFLFAKMLLPETSQVILVVLASCLLVHGFYLTLTPNLLANCIFPIPLYLMVKYRKSEEQGGYHPLAFKVVLVLFIILYPPFHPVPTLALLVIVSSILIGEYLISPKLRNFCGFNDKFRYLRFSLFEGAIVFWMLLAWGITWITAFLIWRATILNTKNLLVSGGQTSLSVLSGQIDNAVSYGFNPVEQIVKIYGGYIVCFILTVIAIVIAIKQLKHNRNDVYELVRYSYALIGLSCITGMLFIFKFQFSPLRFTFYFVVVMTVFVGFLLNEVISHVKARGQTNFFSKIIVILLIIGIFALFAHGILKTYPSPYIKQNNLQTTMQEVDGMSWVFEYQNGTFDIAGINVAPGRFADLLYTPEYRQRNSIKLYLREEQSVPFHYGYDTNRTLYEGFPKEMYMVVSQRDQLMYRDTFPTMATIRWLPEDFERLHRDPSLNRLYSNGGFSTWRIIALNSTSVGVLA